MLCASRWGRDQTGLALVLEPITFSIDTDDDGVVKVAVPQGQRRVISGIFR
jgi:hypothetical protein